MRNKNNLILAIVLLSAVFLSSCTLPQKSAKSIITVTVTAEGETAAMPSASPTQQIEVTATLTATPTKKPTTAPTATPTPTATPEATNTPQPTPTHTPQAVSLPKKSSVTGETLPKNIPAITWRGVPIPEDAITGQKKKNEFGEQYYIFTIQSEVETLMAYYTEALKAANWVSTEGGKSSELAFAFFTKGNKILRFEFIIEDGEQKLLLVRIFKR